MEREGREGNGNEGKGRGNRGRREHPLHQFLRAWSRVSPCILNTAKFYLHVSELHQQ